ncbi:uncharacterized protein PV07_11079 [Cladophialophora immunda]|uniref:Transcription factor domain-containing protein n=1 Tax=Cladophialophora immunda TaxID=569365 RepID=A0A0D2BUS7_9EURO|nr:uncharacterized protein PV07_11079 [Cladophialophora immunda]KIW22818.1 hypothetical protein PV07_11079 [Cladophialophora immunda]OQU93931.1 Fungal specific transcription factor domain-containing protein isoform 1 [Cladophialophora immunda]OQU93932.1 Fungal specific transcription factor domain-containing protein isoform 2 [Cladophialophora immunda]
MESSTSKSLVPIKRELVPIEPKPVVPPPDKPQEGSSKEEKSEPKPFKDLTREEKLLAIVRHSVRPFSDRLDPFAALPVNLDRFQEHLISFYLLYYPKATYGFSPRLRPHPVASNFSIALTTPACFQVIMARSALYRISLNKYATDTEKRSLELAVVRHKGEALKMVRQLSSRANPNRKDDLLASIISLGTFDRRSGSQEAAGMHYQAVRKILKTTGGPLAVNSVLLSRVMCFFECIYGTSPESYIWDNSDLKRLVRSLNGFLEKLWEFWQSLSTISALTAPSPREADPEAGERRIHSFDLQEGSTLLGLVSRQPPPGAELTQPRRLELIFQLTCLLTLAMVTVDLASDFRSLQTYMDNLHQSIEDLRLAGQSCNNAMWQIQVNDHSETHSRRIWRAASYAWVMKHCSYNVQKSLKEWLLAFFTGKPVEPPYHLASFHFSYAT